MPHVAAPQIGRRLQHASNLIERFLLKHTHTEACRSKGIDPGEGAAAAMDPVDRNQMLR